MSATTTAARTNTYPGKCRKCATWITAGSGLLVGSKGAWGVEHVAGMCSTAAPTAPARNAEPGYYVRADGKAIVVVAGKRNPERTYGKVLDFPADGSRPSWNYVPGAGYSVAEMRPMTAADAAALGLSHGYCIKCCAPLGGETLSACVSALIGYGETCARNLGWPYPKGVVAQRAYIAENGS
jgi:hypothetical protein